MSEIKLVKRIKYAGDVHAALMELGWDAKTAAAFLDDIPDADAVEVVRCEDCKAWQTETALSFLRDGVHVRCCSCGVYGRLMYDDDFCSKGKRRTDK